MDKKETKKMVRENSVKIAQGQEGRGWGTCGMDAKNLCQIYWLSKEEPKVKTLKIRWQRLVSGGQTCLRCGSTDEELEKAISTLKQSFIPLGIEVVLEKDELSAAEFKKDPLRSNQIWLNNQPLEDWIGGKVGESPCCDICGPSRCRTVEVEGKVHETIPADLIIKAGLIAASRLVVRETNELCCESRSSKPSATSCCQK